MITDNLLRLSAFQLLVGGFSISAYFRRKAEKLGQGDDIDFSEEKTGSIV